MHAATEPGVAHSCWPRSEPGLELTSAAPGCRIPEPHRAEPGGTGDGDRGTMTSEKKRLNRNALLAQIVLKDGGALSSRTPARHGIPPLTPTVLGTHSPSGPTETLSIGLAR